MAGLRISIIGTGYVGLVTGACLAESGHKVVCVDIDAEKVDAINRAVSPIHEQGLDHLLQKHIGHSLRASTNLAEAVLDSEITFIAAGTPFDGQVIDLRFIKEIAMQIGVALAQKEGYHVVAVKSTVVPGTTDDVVIPLLEKASGKKAGRDFGVGVNPEFLSEGVAVEDFMRPDRIVIGGIDDRTIDALAVAYAPFEGVPILGTNNKTAEMVKYASNALQATAISFANEIGNLCAALGHIDVTDVMKGVHLMKELSPVVPMSTAGGAAGIPGLDRPHRVRAGITNFLNAGCGFGGSCFPKDIKALCAHGRSAGMPMRLLDAVIAINDRQPHELVDLVRKNLGSLQGVPVTVLGLAFKPGTDDMRESPAIPVVNDLLADGALVRAYDPAAAGAARKIFGDRISYAESISQAVENAKAIVIVTRWDQFNAVPDLLSKMAEQPLVVDGRRMLDRKSVKRYVGIGM